MSMPGALSDLLVLELGDRVGVGACGSLLAQLGAEVILVEPTHTGLAAHKWRNRAVMAAGKRSLVDDCSDPRGVTRALLESADVVLLSSDVTSAPKWSKGQQQVVCDITAFGACGPLAHRAYSDTLVQALAGVADTTGDPAGPPSIIGFEVLEFAAGIYAVSAVLAALRVRQSCTMGQDVEIALFDCAVAALSTFLPFPMVGKTISRSANRHALTAPWNAYRASDGWVLICTATDEQWRRLRDVLGGDHAGFDTNPERVARLAEVDTLVQAWVAGLTVSRCVERLAEIGIACGPIVTVEQLLEHENLQHRDMVRRCLDPVVGREIALPGSPIKATRTPGIAPVSIARPDQDRTNLEARCLGLTRRAAKRPVRGSGRVAAPLDGVRVLELGQFTTAPLVARQMGALGAEVLKIEPPGGEGSRHWEPQQGQQGYFFTLNNSNKRSLALDLNRAEDKAQLQSLLHSADVLVENLKPGSLARLGFSAAELAQANPRLVYCAISGFGADSVYPGRPAFDTVVQAMCGFMDLTRPHGAPTKTGISAADVMGGELALCAILAALEYRERSGLGQSIDIAMQDVGAWITQMEWGRAARGMDSIVVQCCDGFAVIEGAPVQLQIWLSQSGLSPTQARAQRSRAEMVQAAAASGLCAAAVNTVSDIVDHPQVIARELIVYGSGNGMKWPMLTSPLRMARTPTVVPRPIGLLGEANAEIFGRTWLPAEPAEVGRVAQ